MILIATDFNSCVRYQMPTDDLMVAYDLMVAAFGDFPHTIEGLADVEDVEIEFGRPLSTFPLFPSLPVVS